MGHFCKEKQENERILRMSSEDLGNNKYYSAPVHKNAFFIVHPNFFC